MRNLLTPTVYSLIFPETRKILDNLWSSAPHFLYEEAYEKTQDSRHELFKEQWLSWSKDSVKFTPFKYFYPTAGSSEAIRDSLAHYASLGHKTIHVFEGEYEGYQALAESYGVNVKKHNRNDFSTLLEIKNEAFYLSQPSSLDGNIWDGYDLLLKFITDNKLSLKLRVDVCYLGLSSKTCLINLDHPSIDMVFFSLSKVFGVYYHRIGGVFSKNALPGLFANIWFKNTFSLLLGTELMKTYSLGELAQTYKTLQNKTIEIMSEEFKVEMIASDVIILSTAPFKEELKEFKRNDYLRFCLSPYMDKSLRGKL